jgi:phage-related protein
MKKVRFTILFFASLAFTALIVSAQITNNKNLFKIERNKNANVVMYDVILASNGNIDKSDPIDSYWILYAKQGQRYKITVFEKNAYGFKIKYNNNGYYELILKAVPDRMIKVTLVNGTPKAEIKINNRKSYLSKVYVFANDNLIPKVLYYTLNGTDIETGATVTEKIIVK